jgi:SAM-dependent methyltransferase
LVFAASVFTHMVPKNTARYFAEAARVLRPRGRFVLSAFLLDNYRAGRRRPMGFAGPDFDFDHEHGGYGRDFAVAVPDDPEPMTAYRLDMLRRFAAAAGFELERDPVPGLWSGAAQAPIGAQDLIVLRKRGRAAG